MSNIPILYRNVMDSLPSGFARDIFLWATDKFPNDRMVYKAEAFAREAESIAYVSGMLVTLARKNYPDMTDEQCSDLIEFIRVRHANWRLGGNIKDMPGRVTFEQEAYA
jgi:hypothetical protein